MHLNFQRQWLPLACEDIETFDLIRVFGSAETRIGARGISQALITTLAGLVMGLFGVDYDLNRRAMAGESRIHQALKP